MAKYPLQSMLGGTLLVALAFSLNDGSQAKSEPQLQTIRLACDSLPDRHDTGPDFQDPTRVQRCIHDQTKK